MEGDGVAHTIGRGEGRGTSWKKGRKMAFRGLHGSDHSQVGPRARSGPLPAAGTGIPAAAPGYANGPASL